MGPNVVRGRTRAEVTASFDFLRVLGTVSGVQDRADAVVAAQQAQLDATAAAVAGKPRPTALVAYPGLSNPTMCSAS